MPVNYNSRYLNPSLNALSIYHTFNPTLNVLSIYHTFETHLQINLSISQFEPPLNTVNISHIGTPSSTHSQYITHLNPTLKSISIHNNLNPTLNALSIYRTFETHPQ